MKGKLLPFIGLALALSLGVLLLGGRGGATYNISPGCPHPAVHKGAAGSEPGPSVVLASQTVCEDPWEYCDDCHADIFYGEGAPLPHEPEPPQYFPLDCFDCHFPANYPYEYDPQECFNCHACGPWVEADGTWELMLPMEEDCFMCHAFGAMEHPPIEAPNFSAEANCFRCHPLP